MAKTLVYIKAGDNHLGRNTVGSGYIDGYCYSPSGIRAVVVTPAGTIEDHDIHDLEVR